MITSWSASLWQGLSLGLAHFMVGIPVVLGALLILVIGWVLAGVVGNVITKLTKKVHVDTVADRIKVNDFLSKSGSKLKATDVLGDVFKWVVRLIFIEMAADQLGLLQVALLINHILAYIPLILVAFVVLGVGLFLAQLVSGLVRGFASEANVSNPNLFAKIASGVVIAFTIVAVVNVLGVAAIVVNTLYIGLVAALALALGLSFGLGGRNTAEKLTEKAFEKVQSAGQQTTTSPLTVQNDTPRPVNLNSQILQPDNANLSNM